MTAKFFSSLLPQLAESLRIEDIGEFVMSDRYWMEQKLDGKRLIVSVEDGAVRTTARRGNVTECPSSVKRAMATISNYAEGRWVFDGELMGKHYWIFDVLAIPLDPLLYLSPYETRRKTLETIIGNWPLGHAVASPIGMTKVARETRDKQELFERVARNRGEGVIIKDTNAPYRVGKRTKEMLKVKFVSTCEAFVTGLAVEGRNSIAVSMIDDKRVQSVGKVTVTPSVLANLRLGSVVEVRYLYATDDLRLYQPAFLCIRNDKEPTDCTIDQLKFTSKEVLL